MLAAPWSAAWPFINQPYRLPPAKLPALHVHQDAPAELMLNHNQLGFCLRYGMICASWSLLAAGTIAAMIEVGEAGVQRKQLMAGFSAKLHW
jgi:hypothetical protein